MRSILEKAIVHLLNEEHDQAQALFHKFMVERARQIHESLRQGEDAVLTEGWDENITSESYFTEDDLDGVEDHHADDAGVPAGDDFGHDAGPVGDDLGSDLGAEGGDEMGGDDLGSDMGDEMGGDEMGGEEAPVEDRLADLEDQLERLTADFEEMMGGSSDDSEGDDFGSEDGSDEFGSDEASDAVDDDMTSDEGSEADLGTDDDAEKASEFDMHESDDSADDAEDDELTEEDDFDDISESIIAELEKVSVTMTDGKEIAAGKSFSQNNSSVGLQKKPNPMTDGKPVQIKGSEHKGFERETAPAVKDMKKRKNTKSKAEDGRSSVSKEGDKGALINKDFGKGGEANTKSPLAKR
jgi:hypothetical protein